MAAMSRRPRLALCAALLLSLLTVACSLVKPTEEPSDAQERAARLAQAGKHAEAAKAYADLAQQFPGDSDNYQLLSAEQWVSANNLPAAKQSLAAVSTEARSKLPVERALVAAEVAYADNDGATAIRELDSIPVPTRTGAELLLDPRLECLHDRPPHRGHARTGGAGTVFERSGQAQSQPR